MPVPDLELLRSFVSVVDAGSFTRAAEPCRSPELTRLCSREWTHPGMVTGPGSGVDKAI